MQTRPWSSDGLRVTKSKHWRSFDWAVASNGSLIAQCYGPNARANAYLYRAAADLFEALDALYKKGCQLELNSVTASLHVCLADAHDALAKALGEEAQL